MYTNIFFVKVFSAFVKLIFHLAPIVKLEQYLSIFALRYCVQKWCATQLFCNILVSISQRFDATNLTNLANSVYPHLDSTRRSKMSVKYHFIWIASAVY